MIALAIQARLGSSRLPRKALLKLSGQTMFEQVLNQVKASKKISKFVLTTSDQKSDEELILHAKKHDVLTFAGPVDDIIGRFWGAFTISNADILVRIWGDCPFVCADVIDAMLEVFENKKLDYMSNSDLANRSFPPGLDLEIYRKSLMQKLNAEVTDPKLREFPIEAIKALGKEVKWEHYHSGRKDDHIHLTVDYPEDLAAAEVIYNQLLRPFTFPELMNLLDTKPELWKNFSHQQRNVEYKNYLKDKQK